MTKSAPLPIQGKWLQLLSLGIALILQSLAISPALGEEPPPEGQPEELVINAIVSEPINFPLDAPPEVSDIQVSGLPAGLEYDGLEQVIFGQIDQVGEYFAQVDFTEGGVTHGMPIRIGVFTAADYPGQPGDGSQPPPDEQTFEVVISIGAGQPIYYQVPVPHDASNIQAVGLPQGVSYNDQENAITGSLNEPGDYYGSVDFDQAGQPRSIPVTIYVEGSAIGAPGDGTQTPPAEDDLLQINVIVGQPLDFPLDPGPEISGIVFSGLPTGIDYDSTNQKLVGTLQAEGHYEAQVEFVESGITVSMPVFIDAFLSENFPGDPSNPNPPKDGHSEPRYVSGVAGQPLSFPLPYDLNAVGVDYGMYADGTVSMLPPGLQINFETNAIDGVPEYPGFYHFILIVSDGAEQYEDYFDFDIAPANFDDGTGGYIPPINIIGDVGMPIDYWVDIPQDMLRIQWDVLPEGIAWDPETQRVHGTPVHPGFFETAIYGVKDGNEARIPVYFDIFDAYHGGGPGGTEEYMIFGFVGEFVSFSLPFDPSKTSIEIGSYEDGLPAELPVGIEIDSENGLIVGFPQEGGFYHSMLKITEGEESRQVPLYFDFQYNNYGGGAPGEHYPPEYHEGDDETVLFGAVGVRFSFKFPTNESETVSLPAEWEGQSFALPTGLSYNVETNAIVGSPTESGIFDVLVRIEGADGIEKLKRILFLVSDGGSAPKLSFFSEAEFMVGEDFDYQILASGSPTEFAFEETPAELSLDPSTGLVSGRFDYESENDLIVRASNEAGDAYGILYLDVEYPHDDPGGDPDVPDGVIEDTEPLVGRVGVPFRIEAPAEFAGATFELVGESTFPAGIGFSETENAVIAGTPTEAGLFRTHISITQPEKVTEVKLIFFIGDSAAAPQFISPDYLNAKLGSPIEFPLALANGPATIEIIGKIPGISYDATSRSLKGAIADPGFYTLLAVASNDNGKGFLLIDVDVWDDGSFQDPHEVYPINVWGMVGEVLDFPLPADPARSEVAIVNGPDGTPSVIPPGLEYLQNYALIKGVPSQEGFYDLHLEVTEFGFTRREHIIFEIYTPETLPDDPNFPTGPGYEEPDDGHVEPILAKVGERLYFEAPVMGQTVSFEIVDSKDGEASELPPGVTFNTTDGVLSGVPTKSGVYPLWVKVNEDGHVFTVFAPVVVSGPEGSPEVTSVDYISALPGENFEYQVVATNEPTESYIEFFDVPGILSYDPESMILNGKFDFGGFFTVLIVTKNETGVGYGLLHIDVLGQFGGGEPIPEIPLFINGTSNVEIDWELPTFVRGSSFVVGEDPGGFVTQLPEGLSMDETTGRVYGTPLYPGYHFVYVTVDQGELPSLALNIGIAPGLPTPIIISPQWWVGHQNGQFNYQIHATDFPSEYFAEGLPAGLSLNAATGTIHGIPTEAGEFEVQLSARNKSGTGESTTLFLFIEEQPRMPVVSGPYYLETQVGAEFSFQVNATESPFSFAAWGLPAGVTLDSETGLISGTPLVSGFFPVRVEAYNEWGMGSFNTSVLVKRAAQAPSYTGPNNVGGKVGQEFFFHPPASGTVSSWSISEGSPNALPAGLSIDSASGMITGKPTNAFAGAIELEIAGPGGSSYAKVYFKIAPALDAPVVSSSPFAKGTSGQAFSYQIVASNNPIEFAVENLPSGLDFDASAGLISGTPDKAGYFDMLIRARNAAGWGPVRLLILDIIPGLEAPMIVSAPYKKGQVGQAFEYQIIANNQPTGFALSGSLPAGLALDATTGLISGTPTEAGVKEVILSASNESGSGNGMVFILAIRPSLEMPKITSSGTAFGKVGEPFVYQIIATGTPTGYEASNLPDGLTLNESTGFITGTPTTPTREPVLMVVVASNGAGQSLPRGVLLEILPAAAAPEILSGSYAIGKVGDDFEFQVFATNDPTSFFSPNLPQGLSIDSATGLISGSPEQAGEFIVTLNASNEAGAGEPASLALFILPGAAMPRVTSPSYALGKVGEEFSYQIVATSEQIDSFSVEGDLPRGIDFDPTTGLISGSPVEPGISSVFLLATNDAGTSLPQPLKIKVEPSLEAPSITSALRTSGTVGDEFSYEILASNMPQERPLPPSAEFEAVGLPAGLGINNATGIISGTPEEPGSYTVTLVATNETGQGNAKFLVIKIAPSLQAPVITSVTKVPAQVGKSFSYTISATNDPTSYDVEHSIAWLGVNTATGRLSGTPTKPGVFYAGLFAYNDSGESKLAPLEIVVYPAAETPKITSERQASGKIGEAFSYQIEASNAPTSYSVSGLPSGLTIDPASGLISGTPAASGVFEIVAVASNENGTGDRAIITLEIEARFEIVIGATDE
ncbi:putative Ig domain-containing protein [Pelagicoccus sp. SDUM812003]|uniref:putative Ig domain-containing protein n=1 Tax=Pelagicoccus sp. SDUM812003 TaxID=3041267 RepID=UPI00280CE07B|nr:putative Ig domain-containing protein [Pelagicoccus sp. SDUM812003]MDQ8202028.1 putative Ig domain-containing protein [Pelagicoccus sp. SDUM812003]